MEPKYFDIHSHLNFNAYDADRGEVIRRMQEAGVGTITVGTQFDTSKSAVALAEQYEHVYATVGLHPIHTSASHHDEAELGEGGKEFTSRGEEPDIAAYRELAQHPKVVAIGEVGLDYYHQDQDSTDKQLKAFHLMIELANEVSKPLMLHIRNAPAGKGGRSAYADAFSILKDESRVPGNLHFFAGTIDEAKPFLDLGYTFSFTGVVTFARSYDEVIKYIPLDRIMSETDAPYVTPAPYRGKRNEPTYVVEVVKKIAEIKGIDVEVVSAQLLSNVNRDFLKSA
jgi:TatD DNase family protein